ncbi:hypothetical protein [Plebeiibacterium sediminum]|uniref:Peptidyl-prolyl cis-trans isomerase n=1 Tax=Plebeiibacterium sediminum TaxID=2992112 RepID=A0AAE3SE54_9BACT|nr:hypothetical protein [Plebeiobacterium sediminum]MCW3786030.1 hypothetical protein [Plebeiobacterium sediminum]
MRTLYSIGILASLVFNSCSNMPSTESSPAVASVDGKVLTVAELQKAIPKNVSKNDSLAFTQNYISRWVKSSLLLRKAELNLSPEEKDVKQILEDYRASLLIHKYQQKLLLEKHSPLITNKEIEDYYNKMSENFILNEDIIKGIFIKLPLNAPNLTQLQQWYKSDNPEDMVTLEEYCYQNATNFDIFLDKWVTVDAISGLLPKPIPNTPNFLKYNKFYEVTDSTSHYLVSFRDYHKIDEIAPLQYVTDKIKAILLNKKRIEFIQNLEEELYQEGLKQKVIKFY